MSRTLIVAELATSHHGDVGLAEAMLHAAAEAGADYVKTQHYLPQAINPSDPQAEWLKASYLTISEHQVLMRAAKKAGVEYLCTPFSAAALAELRQIGLSQFKIASSEAHRAWWRNNGVFFVSWPWGEQDKLADRVPITRDNVWAVQYHLTAIPLYPTPLEAVGRAKLLEGYSDHCEGNSAAMWAIAQGVRVLEVHVTYPGARQMSFDKSMDDLKRLRDFAEDCETMSSGVARRFRERWSA